ncbi:hypothetical protein B0H11DRAFT_407340 [Mycena galericulata]|nr:hypothetical protein B0H11DRAFT_407340 [Mycena galericulata]
MRTRQRCFLRRVLPSWIAPLFSVWPALNNRFIFACHPALLSSCPLFRPQSFSWDPEDALSYGRAHMRRIELRAGTYVSPTRNQEKSTPIHCSSGPQPSACEHGHPGVRENQRSRLARVLDNQTTLAGIIRISFSHPLYSDGVHRAPSTPDRYRAAVNRQEDTDTDLCEYSDNNECFTLVQQQHDHRLRGDPTWICI